MPRAWGWIKAPKRQASQNGAYQRADRLQPEEVRSPLIADNMHNVIPYLQKIVFASILPV